MCCSRHSSACLRVPAHESCRPEAAHRQKLGCPVQRVWQEALRKRVWRLQEGGVTATQERPNGTSLQPEKTTKPGRRVVITMQRPYWDGRCLALERTEFQLLQGSNKCRSAAVWCLCFSVAPGGQHQTKRQVQPCESMQPVLVSRYPPLRPGTQLHSRPACGLFVRIRSRLRRSGPRSEWTSIGTLTSQSGRDVVRKKGTSRRRLGESFVAGLLVHGCWVCASLVLTRRPLACLASILHSGESHWPPDSFLSQKARVGCQGLAEPVAERKPAVQFFLVSGCFWFGLTRLSPACRAWTVTPSSYTAVAV